MNKNVFVVYTKVGCPYCTKVTSMLELAELRFVEYKLGRDYESIQSSMKSLERALHSQELHTMINFLVGVRRQSAI